MAGKVSATYSAPTQRVALDAYAAGAVVLRPADDGVWLVGVTHEEGGDFDLRFEARSTEIRAFASLIMRHVQ